MKFARFTELIHFNTKTDSNTFTSTDMLMLANVYKDEIAMRIKDVNEDYFGMKMTRNLAAGVRSYSLPADLLASIERVEAKIDGVEFKPLEEVELPLLDIATNEDAIRAYFTGKKPSYDLYGGQIMLYTGEPIIDVDEGLALYCFVYPTDFANLTDNRDMSIAPDAFSNGFPREFHELLARRVGIAWKQSQDVPVPLTETELAYENDLQKALKTIRIASFDRAIPCTEPVDNGEEY